MSKTKNINKEGDNTMQELIEVQEEPKRKKREIKMEKVEKTIYDLPGVGAATAEKLIAVGFTDLMSIAVASP